MTRVRTALSGVAVVASHAEARAQIGQFHGSAAVVHREHDRAVVFECPCGCGDVLVINVDPRAGPAWRIQLGVAGLSLMPSVWRTSGCESHFILWRSRFWWCRFDADDSGAEWPSDMDDELREEWREILRDARNRRR